jgi:predicted ATPase
VSIQKLKIAGFRSLRDATWEPGKLNVVIGPNGSGKSNLLRALALLQKSVQGDLPEEILRMGGIAPLLWDGQVHDLSWTLEMTPPEPPAPTNGASEYELVLRQLGATSAYRVERERLGKLLERRPGHAATFDVDERGLVAHEGSVADDQTLLSLVAGPFGNPAVLGFRDTLASWGIYHDIHVDAGAALRQAAVTRLDKRLAPDGQNLIPVLHTLYTGDREFKRSVDAAMTAAFGLDYEELLFPPAADQRVQLRLRWRSLKTEQSAANLSDGTIRFLLLLAVLANPEPGALIAVDEPETGLHPGMFPILAELAAEAAERTQVIFTTHSPELLAAFTGEPPTTTVAQWSEGATRLDVVDGEELRRWLSQYSLGALFRSGELEGMV